MIVNGIALLSAAPIRNMVNHKVNSNGVSYGLGEGGYDIRIKQDVYFDPHTKHHIESWGTREVAGTPRFQLASAMEEFHMPSNLLGIVHDKSTWARKGLSVFNTVIEPGWCGWLTLELVYHGVGPLVIPAGSGIAQVIFHRTEQHAYYHGKYQYQADEPVSARFTS